jgi:hypothetical protein
MGHYASKCPEGNNKAKTQGSLKEDLNIITCFKRNQKEATQEDTPGLQ